MAHTVAQACVVEDADCDGRESGILQAADDLVQEGKHHCAGLIAVCNAIAHSTQKLLGGGRREGGGAEVLQVVFQKTRLLDGLAPLLWTALEHSDCTAQPAMVVGEGSRSRLASANNSSALSHAAGWSPFRSSSRRASKPPSGPASGSRPGESKKASTAAVKDGGSLAGGHSIFNFWGVAAILGIYSSASSECTAKVTRACSARRPRRMMSGLGSGAFDRGPGCPCSPRSPSRAPGATLTLPRPPAR